MHGWPFFTHLSLSRPIFHLDLLTKAIEASISISIVPRSLRSLTVQKTGIRLSRRNRTSSICIVVVWCWSYGVAAVEGVVDVSNYKSAIDHLECLRFFHYLLLWTLIDWWDDVWNERFSMNYLSIDLCLEMQFYIKYHWSKNKKICDRNGSELRSIPVHKSSKKHDIDWNQSHFLTDERCKVHSWILAILCDHRASDLSAEC